MLAKHIKVTGITCCRDCGFVGSSDVYKRYHKCHFPTLTEEEFYELVKEDYFGLEAQIINSTDYISVKCPRCQSHMSFTNIYDIVVEDDEAVPEIVMEQLRASDEEYKKRGLE